MSKKQEQPNELVKNILEDTEALAVAIERLDQVAQVLNGSRLKKKAVLVLLSNMTG